MLESALHLNRDTGVLSDAPTPGSLRLLGAFTVGVTAPVVLYCRLHGRFEAHGTVAGLGMRGRAAPGPLMFARALLAAAAGDCRTYRRWAAGLRAEVEALIGQEHRDRAVAPIRSWRGYLATIARRTPVHDALRALAEMPLPTVHDHGTKSLVRAVVLNRRSGMILTTPALGPSRPSVQPLSESGELHVLPKDTAWLVAPCVTHGGFEQFDTFGAVPVGELAALKDDLAVILAAEGAETCDEYDQRLLRLREEMRQITWDATGIGPLAFCQQLAAAIVRVSENLGWIVARALTGLADAF